MTTTSDWPYVSAAVAKKDVLPYPREEIHRPFVIDSVVLLSFNQHFYQTPIATALPAILSFLSSSDLQAVYTSIASMEPPPTQELFDNMDDAVSFAKSHAERHGYALTRANLIRDKRKEVRRLDLRCDKGGKKRGEGIVRNTSTPMTESSLSLRLQLVRFQLASNADQAELVARIS